VAGVNRGFFLKSCFHSPISTANFTRKKLEMNPALCKNSRVNNCLKWGTTNNTLLFDSKMWRYSWTYFSIGRSIRTIKLVLFMKQVSVWGFVRWRKNFQMSKVAITPPFKKAFFFEVVHTTSETQLQRRHITNYF